MSHSIARRATPAGLLHTALGAFLLCLLQTAQSFAMPAADDIVVVATKGDVQITMAGATRPAQAGSSLALPASVRTGHDGSLDLRQGETTIRVGPETQLEFPAPARDTGGGERIAQPRGNAFYDVSPREGRRFRVETPWLVAVIKGTAFNVSVDGESATVSLFEGRLDVLATDGDAAVVLNAGEVATRRHGEDAIRVLKLNDEKAAFAAPDAAAGSATTTDLLSPDADDVLTPDGEEAATNVLEEDFDFGDETGTLADGGAEADLELNAGDIDADVSADLDPGAGSADLGADADIDLGAGDVDVGADAGLDLGDGEIDAGLDADVDLDAGPVDAGADADADVGLDLGDGTAGVGADVGVDLGDVEADAGVEADADLDAGTVDAGVDADVLGNDASVDLGVDLVGEDAGLDVGLDLGGDEGDGEDGGDGDANEFDGLLDGLLRSRD